MKISSTKKIIFHIGDPKTGTSSIQRSLIEQAIDSGTHKLDYFEPQVGRVNAVGLGIALVRNNTREIDLWFAKIRNWLKNSEADVSLVSSENISLVNPKLFKRKLKQHLGAAADQVSIVSYVRPHGSRFLSTFIQRTKLGDFKGSYLDFFNRMEKEKGLYYHPRASAWQDLFNDRFMLRPFVRSELHKNDVVEDFFFNILGDDNFTLSRTIELNKAMSLRALSGLRLFHQNFQAVNDRTDGRKALARALFHHHLPALPTSNPSPQLDKSGLDLLFGTYVGDAKALDAAFFSKGIMTDAFEKSRENARDEPIDLSLDTNFSSEDQLALIALYNEIYKLCGSNVQLWRAYRLSLDPIMQIGAKRQSILKSSETEIAKMDELLKQVATVLAK